MFTLSEQELPYFVDTDPRAVKLAGDLFEAVIDFDVPGLGILHDPELPGDHRAIHRRHGELIVEAATQLQGSSVITDKVFAVNSETPYTVASPKHIDAYGNLPRRKLSDSCDYLSLLLRLNTVDSLNGAYAELISTAPGIHTIPGDIELFEDEKPTELAFKRGYDGQPLAHGVDFVEIPQDDSYDPIIMDGKVFNFHQTPLSSVLYVAQTWLGPAAIHRFSPVNPEVRRTVISADLHVCSQAI